MSAHERTKKLNWFEPFLCAAVRLKVDIFIFYIFFCARVQIARVQVNGNYALRN